MAEEQKPELPGSTEGSGTSRGRTPWWQSGVVVTLLGALAAAVAPVTAAVEAKIQKDKELAAAEREQDFKMRMSFLDLAIDPARSPADRQAVLRFLKVASKDEALSTWAASELEHVNGELDDLRQELKKKEAAIAEQSRLEEQARAQLTALQQANDANEKKRRAAEEALARAQSQKASVQADAEQLQQQLKPGAAARKALMEDVAPDGRAAGAGTARPLLLPASSDRCAPGTVRARPALGVDADVARGACEQALQGNAEVARRVGALLWEARVTIGGREGTLVCVCRPSGG